MMTPNSASLRTLFCLLVVVAAGCDNRDEEYQSRGAKGDPDDKVYSVSGADAKMNAAIATARASTDAFVRVLRSPAKGQSDFSLKKRFEQDGKVEHIWLTDISYDGTRFTGVVNNTPDLVTDVKLGQTVTAMNDEVSDWFYVDQGKLVGGYTIRVLRDAMSDKERKEFDASMPFKFD